MTRIGSYGDAMVRNQFLFAVVMIACLQGSRAPAQGAPFQTEAGAQPSLNQSLSIEEPAPKLTQAEERNAMAVEVSPPAESNTAQAERAPAKSTTILGRKRSTAPYDGPGVGASETPWYRTGIGALGIVLALMGVVYFGLKRWAPSMRLHDGGLVRIVSRTVVGPRQSVVLLCVGRRMVLVGVSPDRMDCVCEIADAEEVAALASQAAVSEGRGPFSSWLDREAAQYAAETGTEAQEGQGVLHGAATPAVGRLLQKLRTTKV